MKKVVLIKVPARLDADQAARVRGALSEGLPLAVDVCVALAPEVEESYVYCRAQSHAVATLETVLARVTGSCPAGSTAYLLDGMLHLQSEPEGTEAPWHYVVETDVTPESEHDFNDWYNQEHMPGLAAVPGTVQADRYQCLDSSPRYYASYDLRTRETFGSPAWLAVRGTDWSSRVRPAFRNTKRTMFTRI